MSKEKYTALILGSTGLIGNYLLSYLLQNNKYEKVFAVTRNALPIQEDKLINIIADFETLEKSISGIQIDHLYCCIGTTNAKTPDKNAYYKIDHDYPLLAAKITKTNNCSVVSFVSSIGANSNSNTFYLKLKGETENNLKAINIDSTNILRPSLLLGKRKEFRFGERIAQYLSPILNLFLVGKLKNYKGIKASTVAKAMLNITLEAKKGTNIYQSEEIKKLA